MKQSASENFRSEDSDLKPTRILRRFHLSLFFDQPGSSLILADPARTVRPIQCRPYIYLNLLCNILHSLYVRLSVRLKPAQIFVSKAAAWMSTSSRLPTTCPRAAAAAAGARRQQIWPGWDMFLRKRERTENISLAGSAQGRVHVQQRAT